MAAVAPAGKRRKTIGWVVFALLAVGIVFCLCQPWTVIGWLINATAQTSDTDFVSQDGTYTAIVRAVDTGAVGSSSGVLLRRSRPFSQETILADGGWGFFDRAEWTGRRVLTVGYGSDMAPDASWVKSWRDVTIRYVPDINVGNSSGHKVQ